MVDITMVQSDPLNLTFKNKGFLKLEKLCQNNSLFHRLLSAIIIRSLVKDTGVKQRLLIAIAEDVPGSYENLKMLLDMMDLTHFSFFIICDLKVKKFSVACKLIPVNIVGVGAISPVTLFRTADYQSSVLKRVSDQYHKFIAVRIRLSNTNSLYNFVHTCLLKMPGPTLVIDVIPQLELHLVLGIVIYLFQ